MENTLVGYVRKSKAGKALRLSVDIEAFNAAEHYESNDGRKFVSLIVNLDKVEQIISGDREVTSLVQITDEDPN